MRAVHHRAQPPHHDDGRFQRTFGPQPPTPYDRGIPDPVEWYRRRER